MKTLSQFIRDLFFKKLIVYILTLTICLAGFLSYHIIESNINARDLLVESLTGTIQHPLNLGGFGEVKSRIFNFNQKHSGFCADVITDNLKTNFCQDKSSNFFYRCYISETTTFRVDLYYSILGMIWNAFIPIILIIFFAVLILILYLKETKKIADDIGNQVRDVLSLKDNVTFKIQEFYDLSLDNKRLIDMQKVLLESSTRLQLANQVAHDIKSPLAALDVALSGKEQFTEDKRIIIRTAVNRIHEISNDLLIKNILIKDEVGSKGKRASTMLLALVHSVTSEKRMQFRSISGLEITSYFNNSSYGLFAFIIGSDLKRVLSNVINNSVEAGRGGACEVSIRLEYIKENALIIISDNGKGMPKEVLQKLGQAGFSYGKEDTESGSGLGFYHAKKTIESFGGEIKVESTVGVGTTVRIYLPLAEPPKTFVKNITVKENDLIAIVDDDQSIHQVWESKLAGVKLEHFNLTLNVQSNADLFLVDYEFLGEEKSGLDFIEENNLQHKAILVTSRYEDPDIQVWCERLNIKLLSKGLVPYVSVVIEKAVSAILIDDDELVRMVWNTKAKDKGIDFKSYADPTGVNFETMNKDISIYIDSNLANGLKGEDLAQKLSREGFKNIYLATGYSPDDFKHLVFLKGVIGKSPPWA